jgi:bifunctional UDP-N-acetylglucosamine pyrophosphorylase/glucosamine-1-phosphate N-acetyltransferase
MKEMHEYQKVSRLLKRGVQLPNPATVTIGPEVNLDNISKDRVIIHSGCKIFGQKTLILSGTVIGHEGPATIENCQIGPDVHLKSGYFKDAVFLEKASLGSGSHVREGTILEEQASTAHTVGLKHTILLPFVTLGSLINFCDCLMAGGTSRKNHSEVGSSYIHFNYTPNQDKATPSLLGNVPNGVMLNQHPIFLGGQGGLVGPCRLAFGTVISAGTIHRKDVIKPQRLLFGNTLRGGAMPFIPGLYRSVKRIVVHNLNYLGNLIALKQWYHHVRHQFISDEFPRLLLIGLMEKLDLAIDERIYRLKQFTMKLPDSAQTYRAISKENASKLLLKQKSELYQRWADLEAGFAGLRTNTGDKPLKNSFLHIIERGIQTCGRDYLRVIQSIAAEDAKTGIQWLQGIVDHTITQSLVLLPSFN